MEREVDEWRERWMSGERGGWVEREEDEWRERWMSGERGR